MEGRWGGGDVGWGKGGVCEEGEGEGVRVRLSFTSKRFVDRNEWTHVAFCVRE